MNRGKRILWSFCAEGKLWGFCFIEDIVEKGEFFQEVSLLEEEFHKDKKRGKNPLTTGACCV